MKKRSLTWSIVSSIVLVLVVFLVATTPLGQIVGLMDPFRGVGVSSFSGVIPDEMVFPTDHVSSKVRVVFDKNFIPHVFADSEDDAFYAVGFLHAWFRLWEMDIQRRLASGRLAEVVGKDALQSDIYMRIIGLRRSAENTVDWLKENRPDIYRFLQSYSKGVNDAISLMEKNGRLPLMFKLLGYKPEPWSPVDSIVWAKYMAWSLTNFWQPLTLTYLATKLGHDEVNLLWPVHPYYSDNVTVVPGDGEIGGKRLSIDPYKLRSIDWFQEWATGVNLDDPKVKAGVERAVLDILSLVGEKPRSIGSNDWAVAPNRSSSGSALMADDPHLQLNMPSLWFAVRIVVPGDMDVFGATLPGIPFVLIGYNRYISWGLTNTQIGVMDFYVEKVDPDNPLQYYYDGEWRRMEVLNETIRVKGGEDYHLTIYRTVHGPVLTREGLTISFKWTGNAGYRNDNSGVTREVIAIYLLNKARGLDDFMEALRYWDVPSQNFMYADVYGNIAVVEPGLFPVRKVTLPTGEVVEVVGSRSLLNGTGGYEWVGYVPYEYVPHAINPERGFLAAPNQMSVGPYYPYFILGGWWDNPIRAQSIFKDLNSKDKHSVEDMMRYQADVFDWTAYSVLPKLIDSVREKASGKALEAIRILEGWDYRMDKDEIAPTIWWAWFSALQDQLYKDYLLENKIGLRIYPPTATTIYLIYNMPDSKWFNGDLGETAFKALQEALSALTEKLGEDMNEWKWGKVHRLYLEHLSGIKALSRGPFPEDGGPHTLMNAPIPWDLNVLVEDKMVRHGPSWRIVAQMDSPNSCNAYGVYPGGQSGNPITPYYDNWVEVWLEYQYIKAQCPSTPQDLGEVTGKIIIEPRG